MRLKGRLRVWQCLVIVVQLRSCFIICQSLTVVVQMKNRVIIFQSLNRSAIEHSLQNLTVEVQIESCSASVKV